MNEQDFAELSAGHALNALSIDDERAYTAALLENPEFGGIVSADAATAAVLAGGVAQVSPPLGARGALMSLIARTPQAPPRPPSPVSDIPVASQPSHATSDLSFLEATATDDIPDSSVGELVEASPEPSEPTPTEVVQTVARRRWMRGMFALAASLVMLVSLGFGAALIGQQINRSPAVVALDRIENAPDARTAAVAATGGGEATAHWSESLGQVVLVTDSLPDLPSGKTYQLWFVRGSGTIDSGGLFSTDPQGESTSLLNGSVQPGDTFAVSVEPGGGSSQPSTTPIILIPTQT